MKEFDVTITAVGSLRVQAEDMLDAMAAAENILSDPDKRADIAWADITATDADETEEE